MRYGSFGPGEDGYDNNDYEYDSDRDAQDSYDDYREQNALDIALDRFKILTYSKLAFKSLRNKL